jgi:uncharacterized surface protein with fasciclin (FAS1) repeats
LTTYSKFRRVVAVPAIGLAALTVGLAGCGGNSEESAQPAAPPMTTTDSTGEMSTEPAGMTIVETAVETGQFTTLVSLLEQTGLDATLADAGPFTVFAPTDEAFSKVPKKTLEQLASKPKQLETVLLYHVLDGEAKAADVIGLDSAEMLNGASVSIKANGNEVRVGGARVVQADVTASNGVIHVIDRVLIPS